jgi:hypothetical protein
MSIKVSCQCGQSFTAKDDLKGQTLLCPKCSQPLTIGEDAPTAASGGGMNELFDDIGLKEVKGRRCPNCGEGLPSDGFLCVHCGFNSQTGEKVTGVDASVAASGERVTQSILDNAATRIEDDKLHEKKNRTQGAPVWMLLVGLALVIGFAVTMYVLPRNQAFNYTGQAIIILAGIVQATLFIRLIIVAFKEKTSCGLLSLFVPPYALYYIFSRWKMCKGLVMMGFGMGFAQLVGWGFIALAPMMTGEGAGTVWRKPPACLAVMADRTTTTHDVTLRTTALIGADGQSIS